jgi:hypothetical protein
MWLVLWQHILKLDVAAVDVDLRCIGVSCPE